MSASGIQDVRQVDFSQPTALNVAVFGKDNETGLDFFNAVSANMMIRIIADIGSAVGYEIDLVKDGKVTRTIPGQFLSPTLPGPVWPPFPYVVAPGQFQVQIRQTKGALAALTAFIVFDHPLGQ